MSTTENEAKRALRSDLTIERYKYILQQIHVSNENIYRFLAIYQGLTTVLVGAALALFVGYRGWHIAASVARAGVIGLLVLTTVVATFTVILILVGILAWLDYRNEECDLIDREVEPGLRARPRTGNFFRWYETYVMTFIVASILVMWLLASLLILPSIR